MPKTVDTGAVFALLAEYNNNNRPVSFLAMRHGCEIIEKAQVAG
jgi:hypothetical protein